MASDSYHGFRVLAPLSDYTGLPLDSINLVVCEFSALAMGYPFRVFLGPHVVSPNVRHVVEIFIGMAMLIFVFGHQSLFILAQTLSCYFLIRVLPKRWMPRIVTVFAMLQLSVCHIWRQVYHYKTLIAIDISAPLMINTQRVTSLAWSLYDGQVKDKDKLTPSQKRVAVSKMPTILEILSYTLNFHAALVGPFFFYKDHINFIEGHNIHSTVVVNGFNHNHEKVYQPHLPNLAIHIVKKLLIFGVCTFIVVCITPWFPADHLTDPGFLNSGVLNIIKYTTIITSVVRAKYLAIWKLGEAVNNNVGLAFYYDEHGAPKWDLADSAHIWNIEFGTSMKMIIDNWNISTAHWLRYMVYDRMASMKTLFVFILTTLWHGFYPGYYLCAPTAALFVTAARYVRRNFRPWFVANQTRHLIYDFVTMVTARVCLGYASFPFIHLEFAASWEVYKRLYFNLHIIALGVIALFSMWPLHRKSSKKIS